MNKEKLDHVLDAHGAVTIARRKYNYYGSVEDEPVSYMSDNLDIVLEHLQLDACELHESICEDWHWDRGTGIKIWKCGFECHDLLGD